jgi:hypothetical protein
MSRSRKKTPIGGMTTATSDKRHKMAEHRRERHAVKIDIATEQEPEHPKAFGNPWKSEKDGKQYFKTASAKDMRK